MNPTVKRSLIVRLLQLVAMHRLTREEMDAFYCHAVSNKPLPEHLHCLYADGDPEELEAALLANDRHVRKELSFLDKDNEMAEGEDHTSGGVS